MEQVHVLEKSHKLLNMPYKDSRRLIQKHWSPTEFEELVDSIDKDDNAVSGDNNDNLQKYRELERPYYVVSWH